MTTEPTTIPKKRKPVTRAQADKAVAAVRNRQAASPNQPPSQRPYLLDSSVVEDDLRRKRDNALSEIEAIEADCLSIEARANNDISAIQARRDTELAARRQRATDLQKIVAIVNRGLDQPAAPAITDKTPHPGPGVTDYKDMLNSEGTDR